MKKVAAPLLLFLVFMACSPPPAAEVGDTVTIEYEATRTDSSLFDASNDYAAPTRFTIGNREVLAGLERAVLGMKEGESKRVLLSPEAAYGRPDQDKIELIPLEDFPDWSHVRIGMMLPATERGTGEPVEGKIINVTPERVVVDFNHPLAGESLWIEVTVKKIEKTKQKD